LVTDRHYARKILLLRTSDGRAVQFGIMRVCLDHLETPVRAEIEQARMPLGRILIDHDVLRTIQLESLYRVRPGPSLQSYLSVARGATTYGRTALIYTNNEPAVELLEIVTPD
jgi:chorismate-pyruvate lyase